MTCIEMNDRARESNDENKRAVLTKREQRMQITHRQICRPKCQFLEFRLRYGVKFLFCPNPAASPPCDTSGSSSSDFADIWRQKVRVGSSDQDVECRVRKCNAVLYLRMNELFELRIVQLRLPPVECRSRAVGKFRGVFPQLRIAK